MSGPGAQPHSDLGPRVVGTGSETLPSPAPPGGSGHALQVVADILNISIETSLSPVARGDPMPHPGGSCCCHDLIQAVLHQGTLTRELARSASPSPLWKNNLKLISVDGINKAQVFRLVGPMLTEVKCKA